ncbi:MAG: hypothetical protein ACT4O9_15920 [Blastocatellia bacterium]
MTINKLNKAKVPIVKIDRKLDKLAGEVLFPEKLEKANEVLNSIGTPKTLKPNTSRKSLNNTKSVRPVRP